MKDTGIIKAATLLAALILAIMLFPGIALAYTEHSGTISSDETWGPGTHYITGTVTVSDNVTSAIPALPPQIDFLPYVDTI
jgi:hypothetical protein